MKKYKPFLITLIIIIALGAILIWGREQKKNNDNLPAKILFYGDTCPHCQIVAQYIEENNIKAKLSFQELEVYNNKKNAALLADKAKQCNVDTSQGIGVPFFFDGQNCLIGDQPIIDYLKK